MTGGLSVFSLLGAAFLWGSAYIAFKYALVFFDPVVLVFARLTISGVFFLCVLPVWRPPVVHKRDIVPLVCMVLCEPLCFFLLEGQALLRTSASQAGMVSATLPILVALVSGFFLRERLKWRSWIGLALAFAGVAEISFFSEATVAAPHPLLGNFLEFLAMVCAAGYTIFMKKLCGSYSSWFLTAMQSLLGALFFLPLLFFPSIEFPTSFPLGASLAVCYLGLCVNVGAYGFYNYGVSKLPAWKAAAFLNLIPVFAIALGWLCLDERLTLVQLCGVGVVFTGVLLCQTRAKGACVIRSEK